jgi:capsular polysaccharide transport system permease protein
MTVELNSSLAPHRPKGIARLLGRRDDSSELRQLAKLVNAIVKIPPWIRLSFIIFVAIPTAIYAAYLVTIASSRYACEIQFAVRGQTQPLQTPGGGLSGALTGSMASLNGTQEANIVVNYILSDGIIQDFENSLKLRSLYTASSIDFWSRLSRRASRENLTDYWLDMVDADVEVLSGIVTVKIQAYTPESAVELAKAVLTQSENLVNRMTGQLRDDTILLAEQEVRHATERVADAQKELFQFRSKEAIIDADKSAKSIFDAIVKLREDRLTAETELNSSLSRLAPNSPTIRLLQERVTSMNGQIRDLQNKLTNSQGGNERTASRSIQAYEALKLEADFANDALTVAENLLVSARNDLDAQHVYVETFVPPALPQRSEYPRPFSESLLLFGRLLALWIIMVSLVEWVKGHGS